MAETTNEPPDPGSAVTSDSEVLAAIRADVETELAHLEASVDVPDDDEPAREFLRTRLRSLRAATVAMDEWRRDRRSGSMSRQPLPLGRFEQDPSCHRRLR
jgi:hypothetical protein